MAQETPLMSLKEALLKDDKKYVRIRARVAGEPKSKTIDGQEGTWIKILLQVEDETGKASLDWCRPPEGVRLQAGDWIEAGPSSEGGKYGGCAIQVWNDTKKIVAWGSRLRKVSPPGGETASAGGPAGTAPRGPALAWRLAVHTWDAAWEATSTSQADPETAKAAALELFKAVLAGRVIPPPMLSHEEPDAPIEDDDVPF